MRPFGQRLFSRNDPAHDRAVIRNHNGLPAAHPAQIFAQMRF
jgi:hypothetical protein